MAKILLVEDESDLSGAIVDWLEDEMHKVEVSSNGADALKLLESHAFDLVLLDWMLPDMDGIEVCRRFRKQGGAIPILILTAKSSIESKEIGLDAGADDYLTKPFQLRELSARIRALVRRPLSAPSTVLQCGDIEIDRASLSVSRGGQPLHLLPKEFALLELFMRYPQRVFSTDELLDRIWGSNTQTLPETVRSTVRGLRNKIDEPGKRSAIQSLYGSGYKFEPSSS